MPDIFDEVQEELRAERARRLGIRYGGLLAGVALLVLLGVGGWQGWQWWQDRQAAQSGALFLEISRKAEAPGADLKAAGDSFASLAATSPEGYQILARLRGAALKAETGDREAALALWDQLSGDAGAPRLYRDLAGLMWVLHGMDTQDPAVLAARLTPLTEPSNPWRASARELQALLAIRRGDKPEAKRILEALAADVTAPRGLRDRAGRLAAGLGV
ncbi:tetratricopeptide repeat protein [Roseomonas sp. M0104]|uniref:Tetratricopeptide repeat protein n=1 Tax=Teichococcus coralli TaxID=2545983 RepID=A0A845BCE2_9PROT|nr:tetratricopeptide repeat protein [Pseudoroseomonas coralli]MXP63754.1 tetratricopeptide repeat protein [Pseudoroseomonas coralli]